MRLGIASSLIAGILVVAPPANAAASGRIAFAGGGKHPGIYTEAPDGSGRQLVVPLSGARADWAVGGLDITDDGSMLAMTFLPGNKGHIYLANSDASNFHQLTTGGDDSDPSFSPDGSSLIFTRYRNGHARLFRIDTDGTGLERLTGRAEPEPSFPSWSPDGSLIAFIWFAEENRKEYIVLTDASGTWFRFLLVRPRTAGQFFQTAWSADSSTVAFGWYDPDYTNADIWTIDADGTSLTQLTDTSKVAETSPTYSPDGSMIACSLQEPFGNWADIMTMNADGSSRTRIKTRIDELNISWGG